MKKKEHDEIEALVFMTVLEIAFLIAVLVDTPVVWTAFIALCVIGVLYIIFEERAERLERRVQRVHASFVRQSVNYTHHILKGETN